MLLDYKKNMDLNETISYLKLKWQNRFEIKNKKCNVKIIKRIILFNNHPKVEV